MSESDSNKQHSQNVGCVINPIFHLHLWRPEDSASGVAKPPHRTAQRMTFIFFVFLVWPYYSKDVNSCILSKNLLISLSVYRNIQIRELLIDRPKIFIEFENVYQLPSLWKIMYLALRWGRVG